jgi:hypothetical protein
MDTNSYRDGMQELPIVNQLKYKLVHIYAAIFRKAFLKI